MQTVTGCCIQSTFKDTRLGALSRYCKKGCRQHCSPGSPCAMLLKLPILYKCRQSGNRRVCEQIGHFNGIWSYFVNFMLHP
ncbi:hypothetical protein D3C74_251270 [compost metagenome]